MISSCTAGRVYHCVVSRSMLIKTKNGIMFVQFVRNKNVKPKCVVRLSWQKKTNELVQWGKSSVLLFVLFYFILRISETRMKNTSLASRLAACEFHLWIFYSTDNKHCTNAMCSLFLQHTQKVSWVMYLNRMDECVCVPLFLSVLIAFSARFNCILFCIIFTSQPVNVEIMQPFLVRVAFCFLVLFTLYLSFCRSPL